MYVFKYRWPLKTAELIKNVIVRVYVISFTVFMIKPTAFNTPK